MKRTLFSLLFLAGCGVFEMETDPDSSLLNLQINHNISRLLDSATVTLNWNELSTEGFKQFNIEKRRQGNREWKTVDSITNRIATTYYDIIYDDENLEYRVGLENNEGDILWGEDEITIPKTLQLFVPQERAIIMDALNDSLIDAGDTIWVSPGKYRAALNFHDKNIVLISIAGPENTIILGDSIFPHTAVQMNQGILDGFTVKEGSTLGSAGGIALGGKGIVRRCIITENMAGSFGGGLVMRGSSELWNCVVFNNFSKKASNGMIINTGGKIINCVFTNIDISYNSNITMDLGSSSLIMLNNIIFQNSGIISNIEYSIDNDSSGVVLDYSFINPAPIYGFGNYFGVESGDPSFIGYSDTTETFSFNLQLTSTCINAGHPGDEYLNVDGTRNTIGSTGGLFGW